MTKPCSKKMTSTILPAVHHRDTLLALTVIEAALGILLNAVKPNDKLHVRCQTVKRWLDTCSPMLRVKRLSSGAQRDLDAACEALAPHMAMDATGEALLKSWAALYWTGFTMLLNVRRMGVSLTVGTSWGWLERTCWSLGYLLIEIAPGCDEQGTDIFLQVS